MKATCGPVFASGSHVFVPPLLPLSPVRSMSEMLQELFLPSCNATSPLRRADEKPCLTHGEGFEERMAIEHQGGR